MVVLFLIVVQVYDHQPCKSKKMNEIRILMMNAENYG